MRSYFKMLIWSFKVHPVATGVSAVIGAALGMLVIYLGESIISDISKGLNEGSVNSLSIIGFVGSIAGLVSLGWLIWDKATNKPNVNVSVETSDKEGVPDKITIKALNYGKVTEVNRTGFIFSDDNNMYARSFTGLLPHRIRSGGVPYEDTWEAKEIVEVLKKTGLSLKYAFVENDEVRKFTCKIPPVVIEKFDRMRLSEVNDSSQ